MLRKEGVNFVSSKLSKKTWKTSEIREHEIDLSGQTIVVEVVRKFQIERLILHIIFRLKDGKESQLMTS